MTGDMASLRHLRSGARIHLIGVAGAGMNALAAALLARGYRLSGSDLQRSLQVERLIGAGMVFYEGHSASQVAGAALVIISAAVREGNPELSAARAAGLPVVKRAVALGWLLLGLRTIAVAGTHGKTTTTSMLAVILRHAGLDPTFLVGGEVLDLGASAAWGSSEWAVVEADEYDRSFLQLSPRIAVITNIEPDHLEYFGSAEAMYRAYDDFVARIMPGGTLVLNWDDPYLRQLQPAPGIQVVRCGYETSDPLTWRADQVSIGPLGTSFTILPEGPAYPAIPMQLPLPGLHTMRNALQAYAAAVTAGVDPTVVVEALRTFQGAGRRFQQLGEAGGITVVDDYAHHPTEIRATLAAARGRFPDRRIVAVFQPHTYSRTQLLFVDFVAAFDDANLLIVTDIYAARETDTLGMDAAQLVQALKMRAGFPAVDLVRDLADVPARLAAELQAGDVVLTLGAGTITGVGPLLLAALAGPASQTL